MWAIIIIQSLSRNLVSSHARARAERVSTWLQDVLKFTVLRTGDFAEGPCKNHVIRKPLSTTTGHNRWRKYRVLGILFLLS